MAFRARRYLDITMMFKPFMAMISYSHCHMQHGVANFGITPIGTPLGYDDMILFIVVVNCASYYLFNVGSRASRNSK